MDKLKKLRERIDWLDTQIASLLDERMRAADQVGKIKRSIQQEVNDPSREQRVLNQVEMIVQHPILKANISNIYREIMQEARSAQLFFQHRSQPFRRIGIIGLGLIGGSICKGLKMKDATLEIGTLTHPSEDESLAREGGWIDHIYPTLTTLLHNSELIILASPLSTISGLAEKIKMDAQEIENLVIIDVASTKGEITELFEKLTCEKIEYISTHPMGGKERGGFVNSQATLFINRPWIVVPHQKNSPKGLKSIHDLILFLGATPLSLEANTHDTQVALVSHLPSILAKLYFDFVSSIEPESLKIAGPGFQSFTRLAHDNPEMRAEITIHNQQAIQDYLAKWLTHLIGFKKKQEKQDRTRQDGHAR